MKLSIVISYFASGRLEDVYVKLIKKTNLAYSGGLECWKMFMNENRVQWKSYTIYNAC